MRKKSILIMPAPSAPAEFLGRVGENGARGPLPLPRAFAPVAPIARTRPSRPPAACPNLSSRLPRRRARGRAICVRKYRRARRPSALPPGRTRTRPMRAAGQAIDDGRVGVVRARHDLRLQRRQAARKGAQASARRSEPPRAAGLAVRADAPRRANASTCAAKGAPVSMAALTDCASETARRRRSVRRALRRACVRRPIACAFRRCVRRAAGCALQGP